MEMLDSNDLLIVLADNFPWSKIELKLSKYYTGIGRPPLPIRLMVGLLLLKQIEDLSDEDVVVQFKRNPYYQYFCGYDEYLPKKACHPTELVKFRNRIGKEGVDYIFKMSVEMHGDNAEAEEIIVDSTVQESNITFPTDGKLAIKIILHLLKIAKKEDIKLRRSFKKETKELRIQLRFFRHPRKIKKALGAMKRLRDIAKIILRDIDRKFGDDMVLHQTYAASFYLYMRVLSQEKNTPNKIYSLHELDAYAINKGKDHKGYEFGTKASIAITKTSGVIVGAVAHKTNVGDVNTLNDIVGHAQESIETHIENTIGDRGYRGKKEVSNYNPAYFTIRLALYALMVVKKELINKEMMELVSSLPVYYHSKISIPGVPLKRDSEAQKEKKRKDFRKRAAIEPIIGHLKSDHRMARNFLRGFKGDEINLLLAASAFNLKKWMRIYFYANILRDAHLILFSLRVMALLEKHISVLLISLSIGICKNDTNSVFRENCNVVFQD